MNITSISATVNSSNGDTMVYGLGSDGKVYYWNPEQEKWELWKV